MNNITLVRKKLNMSQSRFAKAFNIPVRSLQRWEQEANKSPEYVIQMIERIVFLEKVIETQEVQESRIKRISLNQRIDFDLFKSNVCHEIKDNSDLDFIRWVYENNVVEIFFEKEWYKECLYILATIDYLCRENEIIPFSKYDTYRTYKLKDVLYPSSTTALFCVLKDKEILEQAYKDAIPEYLRHNIVEGDIRNVI